jgi:hypothetical protein
MSLHTRGNAILDGIPIESYTTKFDIDFHRIGSENRNIAYQYDYNSVPIKTMTNRDYSTITPEILISV